MPKDTEQEKTEPATPKRRQELKEKAEVAKSKEICTVSVLLLSILIFYFWGNSLIKELMDISRNYFLQATQLNLTENFTSEFFKDVCLNFIKMLSPLFIGIVIAAIIFNLIQTGIIFSAKPIIPDIDRINPLRGIRQLVSKRSIVELLKSILKILIIGFVSYLVIYKEISRAYQLNEMNIYSISSYIGKISLKIIFHTSWVLIFLALLDYGFQKWEFEQSIKMTKQEVKDEYKQREGDPLIKARIRKIQRELSRKRMIQEVPKADVVITNPVHLAVALRYVQKEMEAPKVVAKGARLLAEKIKEIAKKHGVPIVENKEVAKLLYEEVEIGQEIPAKLYKAVAEILAYVYRLKNKVV